MVNLKSKYLSEDMDVDERLILKWILGNGVGACVLDLAGSGHKQMAGSCEHGKKPVVP